MCLGWIENAIHFWFGCQVSSYLEIESGRWKFSVEGCSKSATWPKIFEAGGLIETFLNGKMQIEEVFDKEGFAIQILILATTLEHWC